MPLGGVIYHPSCKAQCRSLWHSAAALWQRPCVSQSLRNKPTRGSLLSISEPCVHPYPATAISISLLNALRRPLAFCRWLLTPLWLLPLFSTFSAAICLLVLESGGVGKPCLQVKAGLTLDPSFCLRVLLILNPGLVIKAWMRIEPPLERCLIKYRFLCLLFRIAVLLVVTSVLLTTCSVPFCVLDLTAALACDPCSTASRRRRQSKHATLAHQTP